MRLRNLDGNKSTGMDKIPPKLIRLSAKVLSKPLVIVIDSIIKRLSPDNSMCFYHGYTRHTDDKYSVTNFRYISVLNACTKIYEKNCKRPLD